MRLRHDERGDFRRPIREKSPYTPDILVGMPPRIHFGRWRVVGLTTDIVHRKLVMTRTRLTVHLGGRFAALCVALIASSALAQTMPPATGATGPVPVAPGTTPADIAPAPGLPGPESVNPVPGATGPYAGHSEHAFYDVDARISRYEQRIASNLSGAQQKSAMQRLTAIKSEEKSQIARHGSLLDWARENLNHRLDQLKTAYPSLDG